jgi:hypothetical protein
MLPQTIEVQNPNLPGSALGGQMVYFNSGMHHSGSQFMPRKSTPQQYGKYSIIVQGSSQLSRPERMANTQASSQICTNEHKKTSILKNKMDEIQSLKSNTQH